MDTLNKPLQQVPINNQLTQTNNPGKYRFIETKLNNINTNIINPTTKLDSKNSSLIIIILILILILILIYFNKSIEIKSEIDYRNMMPRLSPNKSAASIDEIFKFNDFNILFILSKNILYLSILSLYLFLYEFNIICILLFLSSIIFLYLIISSLFFALIFSI